MLVRFFFFKKEKKIKADLSILFIGKNDILFKKKKKPKKESNEYATYALRFYSKLQPIFFFFKTNYVDKFSIKSKCKGGVFGPQDIQ